VYIDGYDGTLRCACKNQPLDDYDEYGFTRHFKYNCHMEYEEKKESIGMEQAIMTEFDKKR